jgi:hypothetical protein
MKLAISLRDQQRAQYPEQGGYSDTRLWPCYMVFSGLILFLTPHIGMSLSVALVSAPALAISLYIADISRSNMPRVGYDIDQWIKDAKVAQDNGLPLPLMENYALSESKIKPIKTEKQHKLVSSKQQITGYFKLLLLLAGF